MHYVYIVNSIDAPEHFYTGYTTNIEQRLQDHNTGKSVHTKQYRPWKLITYIAFNSKDTALNFEKYLKSGSGRAFSTRHFK